MEFVYGTPSCGEKDLRPALLKDVHYLYFALILLALTALIITAVSLCTAPIPEQHVTIDLHGSLKLFILIVQSQHYFLIMTAKAVAVVSEAPVQVVAPLEIAFFFPFSLNRGPTQ